MKTWFACFFEYFPKRSDYDEDKSKKHIKYKTATKEIIRATNTYGY